MCSAYPPLRHPWLDLLQALHAQDPWLTHLPHQYLSQSLAHSRCSFKKWLREGMDGKRKRRRVKHQISGLPHLSPSLLAPLLMLVLVFNPEPPSPPLHVLTPGPFLTPAPTSESPEISPCPFSYLMDFIPTVSLQPSLQSSAYYVHNFALVRRRNRHTCPL